MRIVRLLTLDADGRHSWPDRRDAGWLQCLAGSSHQATRHKHWTLITLGHVSTVTNSLTQMFTISLMTSSKILPHEVQVLVLGIVLISHLRSLLTAAGLGALCRTRCRLQTWAGLSCERGLSIAALPPLLPQHRLIQGLVWPGLITAAPALCPSLCSVCRVLQCPGRL